jgi:exonuclease III
VVCSASFVQFPIVQCSIVVPSVSMACDQHCILLNWNARGLNSPAGQQVVKDLVLSHRCKIVCLKETKLHMIDDLTVEATLGQNFISNYAFLPSQGTRGGLLLACSGDRFKLSQVVFRPHSVTATITRHVDNAVWSIIGVYGPQGDVEKLVFLQELKDIKPTTHQRWIALGDFNLICWTQDKSHGQINRRLMNGSAKS